MLSPIIYISKYDIISDYMASVWFNFNCEYCQLFNNCLRFQKRGGPLWQYVLGGETLWALQVPTDSFLSISIPMWRIDNRTSDDDEYINTSKLARNGRQKSAVKGSQTNKISSSFME